jgi:tetratricopeptide (TPR) repeat protein
MEVIEIREDTGRSSGAVLRIDGYEHPITVASPFDADQLQELDWYFEQHLRFPFTDQVRARQAGESVTAYGEALFGQLITSSRVREAYGALKRRAYPDGFIIEVIGSPVFQALHWEALKDPELPRPFALDVPIVRRGRASAPPVEAVAGDSPTLNLLVLTARPHEAYDVGYRTITRPLVATLRRAQLRVDVDFVRPGTWQALVERLEVATRDHGAGHYHAIHFDLHGGLLSYHAFVKRQEAPAPPDRLTLRSRWGRGEIAPYEGKRAFLFFQPTTDDPSGLGEAKELAHLLLKHKIPIAILNACQSGKQVGVEESSLAARLLEAGMQSVLGMAWSVTVSAAERLIPKLYGDLFAGLPLGSAVLAGRQELNVDKARRAAFNETIELEDWLLPVAYQNREPRLVFRDFTPDEAARWYAEEAERSPDPVPEYGFFGRDLDVLRIETALLTRRNLLLVQGMGGSGKTTLLRHLAHWWELTGLTERSFYFGWDERAWTWAQIMRALAPHVLPADAARAFDVMNEAAQRQAVVAALRGRRRLLILDNLESVTAAPLAIPHSLDANRREELRSFLAALAGGQTLVLMGSRGDEAWLGRDTFAGNLYQLEGLDPEAASDLADAVLQRAGAQGRREESAFKDLMTLLAGYPLALQVVLPHLAAKTAAIVLEELRRGLAEADDVPGTDPALARTRSLMACIEYSHGHLDPDAQALLTCFAPFTGVINTNMLERYRLALAKEPALAGLPLDRLGEVLERARGLGLLQSDARIKGYLRPQPALSWFLTGRLGAADQVARRHAIERAFREHYDDSFAAVNFGMLHFSGKPEILRFAQFMIEQEYANLGMALRFALDHQASIRNLYRVLSEYLNELQDHRRGRELGELVLEKLEHLRPEALTGRSGEELVHILDDIAKRQHAMRQLDSARATSERALAVLDGLQWLNPYNAGLLRVGILYRLGAVAQEQGRFAEAEDACNKALKIALNYDPGTFGAAAIYNRLGMVAQQQHRLAEAEDAYNEALKICRATNHREGAAATYDHLGRVAEEQRRFAEAEGAYNKALEIKLALANRHSAAITYYELGQLALEQRRFAEAENAYKEALEIYVEFNDRYEQAGTYHELGRVAEEQRRFAEAEGAYNKALEIYVAFDDRPGAARAYHHLGIVAQEQRFFAEAEDAYNKALEIFLAFDHRQHAANTYHQLGIVAQLQRRFAEAEDAYNKALKIYLALDDRHSAANTYHALGSVAHQQRRFVEANDAYEKALEVFFAFEDYYRAARVLQNVAILANEFEPAKELLRKWAEALSASPPPDRS